MKKRIEHTLLWIGLILALLIIYLTKFDKTESSSKLIYDLGQQIWFNISIAYLSSIIFYMVVVYIPERRKRKLFHFYIGMDINILHSRSWMLFMHLRDAAGMESEIPDTGNIQYEDVKKMMSVVNFDTVHKFNNERGTPTETFKSYLDKFSVKINIAINNSLLIPYDDAELTLLLLQLKIAQLFQDKDFIIMEICLTNLKYVIFLQCLKNLSVILISILLLRYCLPKQRDPSSKYLIAPISQTPKRIVHHAIEFRQVDSLTSPIWRILEGLAYQPISGCFNLESIQGQPITNLQTVIIHLLTLHNNDNKNLLDNLPKNPRYLVSARQRNCYTKVYIDTVLPRP
ncbi:MAG: hypothetical protein IPG39_21650 [Bacteroidetes bacterium]|nr:hypothetical protein [Bacteroidota bacterium]